MVAMANVELGRKLESRLLDWSAERLFLGSTLQNGSLHQRSWSAKFDQMRYLFRNA